MIYQRPIFCSLSAFYCVFLGLLVLYQNPKVKLNRIFALYNISLAIWNISDFVIFYADQTMGLFYLRLLGIGGCFAVPFILHFIYELVGISNQKIYKNIINSGYVFGAIFSLLHFTPWILEGATYTPYQQGNYVEETGPLYPFFAGFMLLYLLAAIFPLPKLYKSYRGFKKSQITYVFLACSFGFLALCVFYLSFLGFDYPYIYYPLEVCVSICFAYGIFRHDLITTNTFIRRAALVVGIYIVLLTVITPLSFMFYRHIQNPEGISVLAFSFFLILIGGLVSMGPVLFFYTIKRLSLFQEKAQSFLTHEMKSPLASIQSAQAIISDELSSKNPDPKRIEDYMAIIDRNTKRLESFAGGFLDFNRIKEKMDPSEVTEVHLKDIAGKIVTDNPNLKNLTKITTEGNPVVQGNKEGLKQVITNLLTNATKYAPGAEITIHIQDRGTNVETVISDKGPGLEQKDIAKIFDPFFRVEKGNNKVKGSGLGLAIVKKWIEYHNGHVRAESDGPGKGMRFIFSLPKKI